MPASVYTCAFKRLVSTHMHTPHTPIPGDQLALFLVAVIPGKNPQKRRAAEKGKGERIGKWLLVFAIAQWLEHYCVKQVVVFWFRALVTPNLFFKFCIV